MRLRISTRTTLGYIHPTDETTKQAMAGVSNFWRALIRIDSRNSPTKPAPACSLFCQAGGDKRVGSCSVRYSQVCSASVKVLEPAPAICARLNLRISSAISADIPECVKNGQAFSLAGWQKGSMFEVVYFIPGKKPEPDNAATHCSSFAVRRRGSRCTMPPAKITRENSRLRSRTSEAAS